MTFLPESMGDLKGLEKLSIRNNPIQRLPNWFGEFRDLEVLLLRLMELIELPESFGNLTKLKSLDLSGNYLSDSSFDIKNFTQLDSIKVGGNHISIANQEAIQKQLPNGIVHITPSRAEKDLMKSNDEAITIDPVITLDKPKLVDAPTKSTSEIKQNVESVQAKKDTPPPPILKAIDYGFYIVVKETSLRMRPESGAKVFERLAIRTRLKVIEKTNKYW